MLAAIKKIQQAALLYMGVLFALLIYCVQVSCSSDSEDYNQALPSSSSELSSSSSIGTYLTIRNECGWTLEKCLWNGTDFGKIMPLEFVEKNVNTGYGRISCIISGKDINARTQNIIDVKLGSREEFTFMANTFMEELNDIGFANIATLSQLKKTMPPESDTVRTSDLTRISARLNSSVKNAGYPEFAEKGFCYSRNLDNVEYNCLKVEGDFTKVLEDLTPNTKYYAKTYITNNKHPKQYSKMIEFTTKNFTSPEIGITNVSNVTDVSAKLNSNVKTAGDPEYTERGFCYSQSLSDVKSSNCSKLESGEEFTRLLEGLALGTKYYAVAYIANEVFPKQYSATLEFTTKSTNIAWYNTSQIEFTITKAPQLAGLAELVNGGNNFTNKIIKLGANITLNSVKVWIPIGAYSSNVASNRPFNGTFDGNGYVISGVYTNNSTINDQGLFGHVGLTGEIKNLGVTASEIRGARSVGILVGRNRGIISNCYAYGSANGRTNVGGLIGVNWSGTVRASYFIGQASGVEGIGGLVGANDNGTISNSYSIGNVYGQDAVGGLTGNNWGTVISNSYSIGYVSGESWVGGLVGWNEFGATVTNSYYDTQTSGRNDAGKGVGRTTEQMKMQSTFSGWDFIDTWGLSSSINNGYPHFLYSHQPSER